MSMERNYYVIAGYDLTAYETEKFDDWKWTDEGEKYFLNQTKDNIQLFDDPMSGNYLYLGYILANGDEYDFETTKLDTEAVNNVKESVKNELYKLIELGVIDEEFKSEEYNIIIFEESI